MSYRYEGKYKSIINEWGTKEECEEYEVKIDNWLSQFNDENRELEYDLLKHFQMYRGKSLDKKIKALYDKFLNEIAWGNINNIFFTLNNIYGRYGNSSQYYFNFRKVTGKDVYDINEENIDDIIAINNNHIVFIDDYSGSGESFINIIDYWINKKPEFRNFEIVFLVVNISKLGLTNINLYKENNKLSISIISIDVSEKAFKPGNIFKADACFNKRVEYLKQCERLSLKSSPFGYEETEALIAFDTCVPNNNLATFREKSDKYKPLIYRERPKISDFEKRQKNKYIENTERYLYKNTKYNNDFKTILFIIYCHIKGKSLDMLNTCELFGMTSSQFSKQIDYCLENGYLEQGENQYNIREKKFLLLIDKKYRSIKRAVKLMINKEIVLQESEYYEIIKYTPIDFEKRFAGYKRG